MRIQNADVAPLNPNTLIAMHVIADFMDHADMELRGKRKIVEQVSVYESLFLEDLAWGRISMGSALRPYSEQYDSLRNPPVRDILTIFHERGLDDFKCLLTLSPEDIKRYEQYPDFAAITTETGWLRDEEAANAWQCMKDNATHPIQLTLLPLKKCFTLCMAILSVREAEFDEALTLANRPYASDHTAMAELRESKPIHFDFGSVGCGRVRDVLQAAERAYLEVFMADRIRWRENTPKWQWQREKVLPVLQERSKQFAHFWVSIADPEFLESHRLGNGEDTLSCSCKLVETLLALALEQTIDILEIAPASNSIIGESHTKTDLRFRVHVREEQSHKLMPARAASAPTPVLSLTRNDRTGEVLMNGQHLITPQSGGTGDRLMEELFRRNKDSRVVKLTDKDIRTIKGDKKYPISNILTNLGFTGDLREAFFPTSSNNAVIFVNPVFESDLKEHGISRVPELSRVE